MSQLRRRQGAREIAREGTQINETAAVEARRREQCLGRIELVHSRTDENRLICCRVRMVNRPSGDEVEPGLLRHHRLQPLQRRLGQYGVGTGSVRQADQA